MSLNQYPSGRGQESLSTAPSDDAPLIHLSADFIRAKEYLEAIVVSTTDAICTTDISGRLIYLSPGAEKMLGVKNADVVGRPACEFYPGGREQAEKIMKLLSRQGQIQSHEMVLKSRDGRLVHVSMSASLLKDRTGRVIGTLGISKDISRRVELENQLRELSITDNLTGLYNQRCFQERLESEASRARRQGYKLTMILMDLDGFKRANDLWGHLEGDRILKSFAEALSESIRKEVDSAYRYGGDEFVLLLPGMGIDQARKVMSRIVKASSARMGRKGVGVSFGITALAPRQSLSDFIHLADQKMFAMKSCRQGSVRGEAPAPRGLSPRQRPTHRV